MENELGILGWLSSLLADMPQDNPLAVAWWVFVNGGFLVIIPILVYYLVNGYLEWQQEKYRSGLTYALLAIDVPKDTEQSPQAVEQIFSALSAVYNRGTWYERWVKGKVQEAFSFEIVSLGGFIQFLVRTPVEYRDLVEAAVYAQYPDAEVTEVEDYVTRIPTDYNTDAYDLWGTEFELMRHWAYPVKTYPEFEHTLSQDFKDPMAQFLETLGHVQPDEDVWLQMVVIPTNDQWKTEAAGIAKRLVTREVKRSGLLYWLFWTLPLNVVYDLFESVIAGIFEPTKQYGDTNVATVNTMANLTPGERAVIEAIERKASKIGFRVKFRMVYWGRRETFLKGRGVVAVVGAIQQYTTLNLNGFKPSKLVTTKAGAFLKQSRITRKQRKVLWAYKQRSTTAGLGRGFVLNTEELATVYHFPVVTVKAPLVKKTDVKKAEPPFALPAFRPNRARLPEEAVPEAAGPAAPGSAPGNIPFVE